MFKQILSKNTNHSSFRKFSSSLLKHHQQQQERFQSTNLTTSQFIKHLKKHHQHRGYIIFDNHDNNNDGQITGKAKLSHSAMEPILECVQKLQFQQEKISNNNVNKHEALFLEISPVTQSLFGVFIHNTKRGLSQGNVDLLHYDYMSDFINQGLIQSEQISRKNALAGVHWGGGKGSIQTNADLDYSNIEVRKTVMNEFGSFVSSLSGLYYANEGFGFHTNDMSYIYERTRFTTCIPRRLGGSGSGSIKYYTGKATVAAMEGSLDYLRMGDLKNKTIAIQGYSKEAETIVNLLLKKGVDKIIVTDIDPLKVKQVKTLYEKELNEGKMEVRLVFEEESEVLKLDVDILAPCAIGDILNEKTIPHIQAKIICGTANNQFTNPSLEKLLRERGIVFVPESVTHSGILSAANEIFGCIPNDPEVEKHFSNDYENSIPNIVKKVLTLSNEKQIDFDDAANELADELLTIPHPFIANRGNQIMKSLVQNEWHKQQL
ncbi:hypothetical protein ABK040_007081 [Willaertia magna]